MSVPSLRQTLIQAACLLDFGDSLQGRDVIPDEKVAEVRERTDIVALVQEYVPLKRIGASFRGLCPFHAEKSPSFYVHPARQFFHCFGCQASGDALKFFMQIEGRTFPEALRTLAERAGVELPTLDEQGEAAYRRARQREERWLALMEAATAFYVKEMAGHPRGAMARAELERRGVRDEAATEFRLGYAPHGWSALADHLRDKGMNASEAEELGLLVPRKGGSGHYDRFRHRLMFPITDHQGRIVAFSGRMLDPPPDEPLSAASEEKGAKYVNSPEGPLYRKGRILFGLYEGRVAIRREGWALVCEGNFDLVALHQAGFKNAVAPMGTALTSEQAKLLRRFAERVVFLFDGDAAGRKAVRAAIAPIEEAQLRANVVALPDGADPDSFLRDKGPDSLRKLIENAPGLAEHLIDDAERNASGDTEAKSRAIAELGPLLARISDPTSAHIYVQRIAKKFGISSEDAVRQQLRRGIRASRSGEGRRSTGRPTAAARAPLSSERPNARLASIEPSFPPTESTVMTALLDHEALFASEEVADLGNLLTSPDLRAIFQLAARMVNSRGDVQDGSAQDGAVRSGGAIDWGALEAMTELSHAGRIWLEERRVKNTFDADQATRAVGDCVRRIKLDAFVREVRRLGPRILDARRRGDDAEAEQLAREQDLLKRNAAVLMTAKG
jgi:DNA primase